MSGAMEI